MKNIKNILISILLLISIILLLSLILSTTYYFDLINTKTFNNIKLIILLISLITSSIYLGHNSNSKGYIEGIKLGTITTTILLIVNILSKTLKIKNILYYLIIVLTTTLGSMIGINTNKKIEKN